MERDRRHFEAEANDQQRHGQEENRVCGGKCCDTGFDRAQRGAAGPAVEQRNTIEQDAR